MHNTLRALPSLDFLRGFEAAGRRLSFTLAAEELFVTQSALSRQIKALEDALGVALFERKHRALALTPSGAAFHRAVGNTLAAIAAAADVARGGASPQGVTLSTTVSFASLWIIPRLSRFRAAHPEVEVYVSADDRVVDIDARRRRRRRPLPARRQRASRCAAPVRRADDAGREPEAHPAPRHAARAAGRPRAPCAAAPRRPRRPRAVARLVELAREQRRARFEARRHAALHALRPGHPGRRRRAGRGARAHSDDRRPPAGRSARRAVREALRFGARLLRHRRAAAPANAPTSRRSSVGCRTRPRRKETR